VADIISIVFQSAWAKARRPRGVQVSMGHPRRTLQRPETITMAFNRAVIFVAEGEETDPGITNAAVMTGAGTSEETQIIQVMAGTSVTRETAVEAPAAVRGAVSDQQTPAARSAPAQNLTPAQQQQQRQDRQRQTESDHSRLAMEVMNMTNSSWDVAQAALRVCDWNVQRAVNQILDSQSQVQSVLGRPARAPSANSQQTASLLARVQQPPSERAPTGNGFPSTPAGRGRGQNSDGCLPSGGPGPIGYAFLGTAFGCLAALAVGLCAGGV